MELWEVYWVVAAPRIALTIFLLCLLGGAGTTFSAIDFGGDRPRVQYRLRGYLGVAAIIVGAMIAAIVPSERQMWTIVGGYAVTSVEGIEDLPPNMTRAANAFLERYVRELDAEK